MREIWIVMLLVGALLAFGCLGGGQPASGSNATGVTETPNSFPNPAHGGAGNGTPGTGPKSNPVNPPATPPVVNNSATPSAPPSPGTSTTLVWDAKKAMKISLLRKGDSLSFDTLSIKLQGITFSGKPIASYQVSDAAGNVLDSFTLGQNESVRFTAPSGEEYLFVAIFNIGEGMPNAVQTQVYRTRDLTTSAVSAQIGSAENSYTLKLKYPKPVLLANRTVAIGQTISVPGAISAELTGIDRSTKPAGVSVRIFDANGAELGTANLQGGQMIQVSIDTQHRYYVVLQSVDASSDQAPLLIYQGMSFVNANYSSG